MAEQNAEAILRELAACKAHDPYQKKPWAPQQLGKWSVVSVPADLWKQVLARAAGVAPPLQPQPTRSNP